MNYRPICDVWILARTKVKYYGAYPAGFLDRARRLMGVPLGAPLLHVCGGKVREYPFRGVGPLDKTIDLDPTLSPDYLQDARDPYPCLDPCPDGAGARYWPGVLVDSPYSEADATHYAPGAAVYPEPRVLLRNALAVVADDGHVGMLHYVWPTPPKMKRGDKFVDLATEVAVVAVGTGRSGRARWFTVWRLTDAGIEARASHVGPFSTTARNGKGSTSDEPADAGDDLTRDGEGVTA